MSTGTVLIEAGTAAKVTVTEAVIVTAALIVTVIVFSDSNNNK